MKKLVVITGASSGIGSVLAKTFSSLGHPLLLIARRKQNMEKLGLENCLCEGVDILDAEAFRKAIEKAETKYGPVDLLINNAGLMQLGEPDKQPLKEWHDMIDVNVKGTMNGINSVLKGMMDRKSGTIINISSIAGRKTFAQHSAYCASKFAVHALSESLRGEVCELGVRVIVIGPGVTQSELLSHTTDEGIIAGYEDWKNEIGGAMDPQSIADTAVFVYSQPQNVCVREVLLAPTMQKD